MRSCYSEFAAARAEISSNNGPNCCLVLRLSFAVNPTPTVPPITHCFQSAADSLMTMKSLNKGLGVRYVDKEKRKIAFSQRC